MSDTFPFRDGDGNRLRLTTSRGGTPLFEMVH